MSKPLAAAGGKFLLALAVLAATGAVQLPAAAADGAATPISGLPDTTAQTSLVTLVTGDQISVTTRGGHSTYALLPHSATSAIQFFRDGTGDEYAIPATAAPFLGRGLDRSLFDVSALLRNGDSARIPVDLSFAAGATPTAPPGVTLTTTGSATAAGYLTPASAAAFGAALRQRIGADVAAGRQPGSSAPAAGLSNVRLTGASSGQGVTPFYPMHLLQVNAIDETGAPAADPFVLLINTDSVTRQNNLVPVIDGVGRIEVPAGHYAAVDYFNDYDAAGNVTATRQVVISDFTVPSSGTAPTLTVDFRTATSPVTASTPRPSVMEAVQVTTAIVDSTGAASAGSAAQVGIPTYVNAAPAPTTGLMHYVVQWDGVAAKASDDYRYDVALPMDNGIPADEAFTVRPDQLATVRQNLSADPAAAAGGMFANSALDPTLVAANSTWTVTSAQPEPGVITQYLGTADGGAWTQSDYTPSGVGLYSAERVFAARRNYRIDWAHGPLAPNWGQYTGPQQLCDACTSGTDLTLLYNLVADSEPDHQSASLPLPTALHLTAYRDNTLILDRDWYYGLILNDNPLTPSTYRTVLDMDMSGVPGFSQSTVTHTDVTVKYDPKADPHSTLPSGDICIQQSTATPCQVLPVLTLHYDLATGLTGTSTGPVQTLALNVGHISYDGYGSHSPITSASVSVSFDGGKTWQQAHVTGHAGRYQAAWPNRSAKGSMPMLRVTATDAGGDSISQTISNAYTIGGNK